MSEPYIHHYVSRGKDRYRVQFKRSGGHYWCDFDTIEEAREDRDRYNAEHPVLPKRTKEQQKEHAREYKREYNKQEHVKKRKAEYGAVKIKCSKCDKMVRRKSMSQHLYYTHPTEEQREKQRKDEIYRQSDEYKRICIEKDFIKFKDSMDYANMNADVIEAMDTLTKLISIEEFDKDVLRPYHRVIARSKLPNDVSLKFMRYIYNFN